MGYVIREHEQSGTVTFTVVSPVLGAHINHMSALEGTCVCVCACVCMYVTYVCTYVRVLACMKCGVYVNINRCPLY
jgi:hypothetical protein